MEERQALDLLNRFVKIHNQFSAIKRRQLCSFEGEQYYPSELHVLTLLSRKPHITVGGIAEEQYITRSAASQIVKKLVSKGLVEKLRNPENEREVFLDISSKGKDAVELFLHAETDSLQGVMNRISLLSDEELEMADRFLLELMQVFDKKLE